MVIRFNKMHGLGNDFVVLDGVRQALDLTPDRVSRIANRRFGVGCDQLLVVQASNRPDTDFDCRIYNADGEEVEQCGNGVRCVARFLAEQDLSEKPELALGTQGGIVHLRRKTLDQIRVNMGAPGLEPDTVPFLGEGQLPHQSLTVDDREVELGAVSMGNPHGVIAVAEVSSAPVAVLGPKIQNHRAFPRGANIGFSETVHGRRIKLRVFERGVGETLACGSGACAAVVVGRLRNELEHEVTVELPGGTLDIEWEGRGHPVFMTGPAAQVFEGQIEL